MDLISSYAISNLVELSAKGRSSLFYLIFGEELQVS